MTDEKLPAVGRLHPEPHQAYADFIDMLDDRSLEDLRESAQQGIYHGDVHDVPDDCETCVMVTRGELRKLKALRAVGEITPPAPTCNFMRPSQDRPCSELFPSDWTHWCGGCLYQKLSKAPAPPQAPEQE